MDNLGIFIFHNDLRLNDNTGLLRAMHECEKVMAVFIFTPAQVTTANKFRSIKAIEFMVAQLEVLSAQISNRGGKLYLFYGDTTTIVGKLITALRPVSVYSNANYTPFALDRDSAIYAKCNSYTESQYKNYHDSNSRAGCEFSLSEDYGLHDIGKIRRGKSGDPREGVYKKFTPFYNAAVKVKPAMPESNRLTNFYNGNVKGTITLGQIRSKFKLKSITIRTAASVLNSIKDFGNYNKNRNLLTYNTTHLSAYLKFGVVSAREVYWEMKSLGKSASDLIKQLYWREFYMNIVWAYPYVLDGKNFNTNYKANWITSMTVASNANALKAWCAGKTGFPIVDACMTELNETGFMHNRGRLIVAGFLTKVLGWHWKFGERYFATKLIDYDPAQNNGNWQFVAGSGVDQQPYFRMFNPWLQSGKYDPEGTYICKWCPQYKDFPTDVLHDETKLRAYIAEMRPKVITPIIAYETARDKTKKRYGKK